MATHTAGYNLGDLPKPWFDSGEMGELHCLAVFLTVPKILYMDFQTMTSDEMS